MMRRLWIVIASLTLSLAASAVLAGSPVPQAQPTTLPPWITQQQYQNALKGAAAGDPTSQATVNAVNSVRSAGSGPMGSANGQGSGPTGPGQGPAAQLPPGSNPSPGDGGNGGVGNGGGSAAGPGSGGGNTPGGGNAAPPGSTPSGGNAAADAGNTPGGGGGNPTGSAAGTAPGSGNPAGSAAGTPSNVNGAGSGAGPGGSGPGGGIAGPAPGGSGTGSTSAVAAALDAVNNPSGNNGTSPGGNNGAANPAAATPDAANGQGINSNSAGNAAAPSCPGCSPEVQAALNQQAQQQLGKTAYTLDGNGNLVPGTLMKDPGGTGNPYAVGAGDDVTKAPDGEFYSVKADTPTNTQVGNNFNWDASDKAAVNDAIKAFQAGDNGESVLPDSGPGGANQGVQPQNGDDLFNTVNKVIGNWAAAGNAADATPAPSEPTANAQPVDPVDAGVVAQAQSIADQGQSIADAMNSGQTDGLLARLQALQGQLNALSANLPNNPGGGTVSGNIAQMMALAQQALALGRQTLSNPNTAAANAAKMQDLAARGRAICTPYCGASGSPGSRSDVTGTPGGGSSTDNVGPGLSPGLVGGAESAEMRKAGGSALPASVPQPSQLGSTTPSAAGATSIGGGYSIKQISPGTVEVFKNGQYIGTGPITSPPGGVTIPANVAASPGGGNAAGSPQVNSLASKPNYMKSASPTLIAALSNASAGPGNPGGSGSATRPLTSSGASSPAPGTTSTPAPVGNASQPINGAVQSKVPSSPSTTVRSTAPSLSSRAASTAAANAASRAASNAAGRAASNAAANAASRTASNSAANAASRAASNAAANAASRAASNVASRIHLPTVSDIRLKRDVAEVGQLPDGLHLYRFRYLWSDTVYVGVMAQEALAIEPKAVVRGQDGYLRVDYDRIGFKFSTWKEWVGRAPERLN
jgi:hypothetical protein